MIELVVAQLAITRKVEVRANWLDIIRGEREEAYHCMLALALKRTFPGRRVRMYRGYFTLDGQDITLPPEAEKMSQTFDWQGKLKARPITFTVEVPIDTAY